MKMILTVFLGMLSLSCLSQKNIEKNMKIDFDTLIIKELDWISNYPFDVGHKTTTKLRTYIYRKFYLRDSLIDKSIEIKLFEILNDFSDLKDYKKYNDLLGSNMDSISINHYLNKKRVAYFLNSEIERDQVILKNINTEVDSISMQKLTKFHSRLQVNPDLIYLAGVIASNRLIKLLKQEYGRTRFDKEAISLALARNGIEPYYSEQLQLNKVSFDDNHKDSKISGTEKSELFKKKRKLEYINSRESMIESLEFLSWNLTFSISHSSIQDYFKDRWLIELIENYNIEVLHEKFKNPISGQLQINSNKNFTSKDMEFAKDYLKQNVNKFKNNFVTWPVH